MLYLRLWKFVPALGKCRNMTVCSFYFLFFFLLKMVSAANQPVTNLSTICLPSGLTNCHFNWQWLCGSGEVESTVACFIIIVFMLWSKLQHYLNTTSANRKLFYCVNAVRLCIYFSCYKIFKRKSVMLINSSWCRYGRVFLFLFSPLPFLKLYQELNCSVF